MKLASLKDGRDGRLVIVSNDLTRCTDAARIAPTLQAALDDWGHAEPHLRELAQSLESGAAPVQRFHERECASPLPRSYQWADGSAYVNHVELVRKARGADMPESFWTDPLIYQGGSDSFIGPRDDIMLAEDEAWGVDFEAEVAVVVDDTPMGVDAEQAREHIRLVMLVNDVSLRGLIPGELGKGFGFFQSKPSSAFSPCAVSPDALAGWRDGKLSGVLEVDLNDRPFGRANVGVDMTFDFGQIIAHAARTRPLGAGAIIGSGTVSNKKDGGPGLAVADGGAGYSCIAELRTIETIRAGAPKTPFMRFGDRVSIDMKDERGHSIFGRIDQRLARYAL